MKFNKERFEKSDKDFQGKSFAMPNKKLLEERFEHFIRNRNIRLNKADIFNYSFMNTDYRVYVSTNLRNSFVVNVSTVKGKVLHSEALDMRGNTRTAADKVFYSLFKEEGY